MLNLSWDDVTVIRTKYGHNMTSYDTIWCYLDTKLFFYIRVRMTRGPLRTSRPLEQTVWYVSCVRPLGGDKIIFVFASSSPYLVRWDCFLPREVDSRGFVHFPRINPHENTWISGRWRKSFSRLVHLVCWRLEMSSLDDWIDDRIDTVNTCKANHRRCLQKQYHHVLQHDNTMSGRPKNPYKPTKKEQELRRGGRTMKAATR